VLIRREQETRDRDDMVCVVGLCGGVLRGTTTVGNRIVKNATPKILSSHRCRNTPSQALCQLADRNYFTNVPVVVPTFLKILMYLLSEQYLAKPNGERSCKHFKCLSCPAQNAWPYLEMRHAEFSYPPIDCGRQQCNIPGSREWFGSGYHRTRDRQ
jgi:hypothetical protein